MSALEKLSAAADTLTVGEGPLQLRLESAAAVVVALQPADLPEALRADLVTLQRRLTVARRPHRRGVSRLDPWACSAGGKRPLSDEEAHELAKLVVDLHDRLRAEG